MEWLSVDTYILIMTIAEELGLDDKGHNIVAVAYETRYAGITKRLRRLGAALAELLVAEESADLLTIFRNHRSDVVRQISCYAVCERATTAEQALAELAPLICDDNMTVREAAWMAYRPIVAADLQEQLSALRVLALAADPRLRRFASEVTRPRGVWCAHLEVIKSAPELGLTLLDPLSADDSRYVQLSVGNWMNDAAKTRADFVRRVCREWLRRSESAATAFICRRSQRSI